MGIGGGGEGEGGIYVRKIAVAVRRADRNSGSGVTPFPLRYVRGESFRGFSAARAISPSPSARRILYRDAHPRRVSDNRLFARAPQNGPPSYVARRTGEARRAHATSNAVMNDRACACTRRTQPAPRDEPSRGDHLTYRV